jgi:Domain of unknown function (DUF4412)
MLPVLTRRLAVSLGAAGSFFAVPPALSAQGFEGAITMRLATGNRGSSAPETLEFLSRAGNVRVSMNSPAGSVAILGLSAEKKTYLVIDAQRTYMDVSSGDGMSSAASAGPIKVTRSGRKETIAGYECEHVLVESSAGGNSQKTDVCMTSALGPYVNPMASFGGGRLAPWQSELAKDGGFPLKVTMADGTVAVEVTKIEKRRVSDAQFRIPAEYTKMDMPRRP